MGVLDRSSTPCRSCRRIEQHWIRNALDAVAEELGKPRGIAADVAALHGSLLAAFAGRIDWWSTNPYAKHRQLYEETGDEMERIRMLRHVTPDA